jgi:hypothetical protein
MSFQKRKQWEGMFEDGVIVEGIETGESPSVLLTDDADETTMTGATAPINNDEGSGITPKLPTPPPAKGKTTTGGSAALGGSGSVVRKTDDVNTFLQTVDLAGVPQGACNSQVFCICLMR